MERCVEQELSGWGGYPRSAACVYRPEKVDSLIHILRQRKQSSYLGRGCGRSYGDAALNRGGGLILTSRLRRFLAFESASGLLSCEAGVSLREILEIFVPRGWFLPVTPGTKFVSIGGAVACDVHGKNHHKDGSISNFVTGLELLTPDGRLVHCSREQNPELFWATMGGMGLTGMVLSVKLQLRPVESAYLQVNECRTRDLDETMRLLEEEDARWTYSVAWLDGLAAGRRLGRGILIRGNHASRSRLPAGLQASPLRVKPRMTAAVPFPMPAFVLNRISVGIFNRLYHGRPGAKGRNTIVDYDRFFYPLDSLRHWNRLYGKRGFVQYQCVVPFESSSRALVEVLETLGSSGAPAFLVVLKRFGAETGMISFPRPGYTLSLDLPMLGESLLRLVQQLDRRIVHHGGRVYLGKDACLSAESFRAMYPGLPSWQAVKQRVDPDNLFSSDLARRLSLAGAEA